MLSKNMVSFWTSQQQDHAVAKRGMGYIALGTMPGGGAILHPQRHIPEQLDTCLGGVLRCGEVFMKTGNAFWRLPGCLRWGVFWVPGH